VSEQVGEQHYHELTISPRPRPQREQERNNDRKEHTTINKITIRRRARNSTTREGVSYRREGDSESETVSETEREKGNDSESCTIDRHPGT